MRNISASKIGFHQARKTVLQYVRTETAEYLRATSSRYEGARGESGWDSANQPVAEWWPRHVAASLTAQLPCIGEGKAKHRAIGSCSYVYEQKHG